MCWLTEVCLRWVGEQGYDGGEEKGEEGGAGSPLDCLSEDSEEEGEGLDAQASGRRTLLISPRVDRK
jgi:hypothetical protein